MPYSIQLVGMTPRGTFAKCLAEFATERAALKRYRQSVEVPLNVFKTQLELCRGRAVLAYRAVR
jgi:hypothetical protein